MNVQKINRLLYAVLITLVIVGCGGGGGASGTGEEAPALSSNQALTGQLISVSHSSIRANDIVDILFQTEETQATAADLDTTAYVIPIKGIARSNGVVDVAVPPFFDDFGLPVTRDVRVLVNGSSSASTLRIEGLGELPVPTDGAILEAFLAVAIDNYSNALDNFDIIAVQLGGAVDVTAARTAIEAQLVALEDQLFELETLGTYTITVDGVATMLSQQELELVDRWLLHSLVSIDVANDDLATNIVRTAAREGQDYFQLMRDAWERGLQALEQSAVDNPGGVREGTRTFVTDGIPDVLNEAKEAFRTGSTYLLGFVSTVATGAGLWGDKALRVAASARNIAAAQLSVMTSTTNAWLADKNTNDFLSDDRDGFNVGQELLSQGVRLGTAYLGSTEGDIGALSSALNTALTTKDMLDEAKVDLCETLGSPSLLCSDDETPATDYNVWAYSNFDGTIEQSTTGVPLDPKGADIKISGSSSFPSLSWSGGGISLTVIDLSTLELVYGITAVDHPDTRELIPFRSPVRYGNNSISNTDIVGPPSSPALQAGRIYVIVIQSADFGMASLSVEMN